MTNTPIGPALAEARQAAGLSVADAAAELGVDRTTLFRWEQGSRYPSRFVEPHVRAAIDRCNRPYRNGSIGVQLVGMPYPVKCSVDELTRASVEVSR